MTNKDEFLKVVSQLDVPVEKIITLDNEFDGEGIHTHGSKTITIVDFGKFYDDVITNSVNDLALADLEHACENEDLDLLKFVLFDLIRLNWVKTDSYTVKYDKAIA